MKNLKLQKSSIITKLSLLFIVLGVLTLLIKNFMPEWVDASGLLHEPYFFMLPLGFGSLFIGLILGAIAFVKSMTGLKK